MNDPALMLKCALEYHALGWCVVPCCDALHTDRYPPSHAKGCGPDKRGKVPLVKWTQYQARMATEDELREWWKLWPHANPCVVLGPVSGVVAWDADNEEGMAELARLNGGPLDPTWHAITGSGGERFFQVWGPGLPPPPKHFPTGGRPLSFLSTGSQSVLPPANHLSGNDYIWAPGRSPWELPCAAISDRLLGEVGARGRKTATRKRGGVERAEATLSPAQWRKRAVAWAESFDGGVWGDHGRDVAYALACSLIHGFHQDQEETYVIMVQHWNARCDPPWPEGELRAKIRSAAQKGEFILPEREDYKPVLEPAQRVYVAPAPEVLAPPAPEVLAPPPAPAPTPEPPRRRYGRLASTVGVRETEWFQAPWFPARSVVMITGKTGSGKSSFLHWLIAKARRPVLFPGFEMDLESMTLPKLCAADVELDQLLIMDKERLYLAAQGRKLADILEQHGADLVCFDPILSYITDNGEENLNPVVRTALEHLTTVCSDHGCVGVGVLHPGKRSDNLVRGASAWMEVPRVVLEIRNDRGPPRRRSVHVEKFPFGSEPAPWEFVIEGDPNMPGAARLVQELAGADADLARDLPDVLERDKVGEARLWLRAVLQEGPRPATWIYSQGRLLDLSGSTLRRAAKLDGVVRPTPSKPGPGAEWTWEAPPSWPDLE